MTRETVQEYGLRIESMSSNCVNCGDKDELCEDCKEAFERVQQAIEKRIEQLESQDKEEWIEDEMEKQGRISELKELEQVFQSE